MIRPADIGAVRFTVTRFVAGYDQGDVDQFLDRVAETIRLLEEQAESAERQAERHKEEALRLRVRAAEPTTQQLPAYPSEPPNVSESASRLLELAQATADSLVVEAEKRAGDTRRAAELEAEAILNDATNEAERRRREAEADARRAEEALGVIEQSRQSAAASLRDAVGEIAKRVEGL